MELKPCPFCGGDAVVDEFYLFDEKWFYVKCPNCKAEINNPVVNEQDALDAWNKRKV